jgi:zinc transporter 5/7
MASTYALPVSMPHNHAHSHSYHTHSPSKLGPGGSRSPNPRTMRQAGSNSSLYSHVQSASFHDYGQNNALSPANSSQSYNSPYSDVSFDGANLSGRSESVSSTYSPYTSDMKTPDSASHDHDHSHDHSHKHSHDHKHDHDHDKSHNHAHPPESRSRATTFLLSLTSGSSLMHQILIEKDSRRIFYFMT